MTALLLLLLFASAIRWSNYSGDSESTGSASSTDDNYFRRLGPSSTYGQDRQSVRLRVGLGDVGSIRVQPQGRGDPAAAAASAAALDVVPDGSDAARCAVELRPCRSCWISLTHRWAAPDCPVELLYYWITLSHRWAAPDCPVEVLSCWISLTHRWAAPNCPVELLSCWISLTLR